MLPHSVITGEADARRAAAAASQPPSIGVFDGITNSPYTDFEDTESVSSIRHSNTPRYQPRSMPSPPLGYDDSAADTRRTAAAAAASNSSNKRLHGLGLNMFKHGLKTNIPPAGHRSNPSSPIKSPVKSRRRSASLLNSNNGSIASGSPGSKHSRHFSSQASFMEYGPHPPISPTWSDSRSTPAQSPVKPKFAAATVSMVSGYSSVSSVVQAYSDGVSPRSGHVSNMDNWTESYLNNNNRKAKGQRKNASSRNLIVETLSESSQSEAGSPSYTHMELSNSNNGGRAVYHYDLTPESQQGSFPNSPRVDDDDTSQMREVGRQGDSVAPILQARLSSMYTLSSYAGRDTGMWSTRSAACTSMTSIDSSRQRYISTEPDENELEELEEMMSGMGMKMAATTKPPTEPSAEKEIQMLMREMLQGQDVVRKGMNGRMEIPPSPQLPQIVERVVEEEEEEKPRSPTRAPFDMTKTEDWRDIERWAGIRATSGYPRESSVATYERSEIDDESMHEEDFEHMEMEAAMMRMSMRSSRHPAEYEGLNEMRASLAIPEVPQIPDIEILTPKQHYTVPLREEPEPEPEPEEEVSFVSAVSALTEEEEEEEDPHADCPLGYEIFFDDLAVVDAEMKFQQEVEDARIREEELERAAALLLPDSRPNTKDGSRPGSRPGLPQLSLLEVPPVEYRQGRASLDSPTSGEESPVDGKGKVTDFSRAGRRHNLKENEIRVEDPSYLVAFKKFLKPSVHSDAFVCRQTRFDSFQTRRICNELPHEYRPLPPPPPKAAEPVEPEPHNFSWQFDQGPRVSSMTPEKRRAKEVNDEITSRLWVFMAAKWLHYGRILISPTHEILNQAALERRRNKDNAQATIRRRILDLGGAPVADWGWHCAYEYPYSKVYTVTSRPKNINIDNVPIPNLGVVEKRRFTGPSNHRHIKVSSLWKLPFPDNHFDVISARTLQTILKQTPPPRRRSERHNRLSKTPRLDEYALTLKECYRVLKPGGHFEWSLTDSDVLRAGPNTQRLAEEFASDLKTRGYDPHPTEKWISRLGNAGFVNTKRAWTILPMAPPAEKPKAKRRLGVTFDDDFKAAQEEMAAELKAWEELGVVKGNTADVAALTGIVGTWRWEEWMVKVDGERENPAWKKGLVNGITNTLEEGRENGSGFRTLVGWTRKPTVQEKAKMDKRKAKKASA
ncbi:hypothetical protein TWF481_009609 [Arthrobotrys musiformis]|uniref:Methyltransferase type 11 domain-containing protein n=1 Tax=Arthrobotrys musiformis TaxID=47236 RepID=A0AAV9W590_9PEZI